MPIILRKKIIDGYKFISDICHEPFHIHVESQDGVAKFEIVDGEVVLKDNDGLKAKDLKLAESIIEENKENFEKDWKEFFGKKEA